MVSYRRNARRRGFPPDPAGRWQRAWFLPGRPIFELAVLVLGIVLALAAAGCRMSPSLDSMTRDPFFETFFDKASLIMTDDEIVIYRSLSDKESKAAFIEEFWKSRDVDATTEENEGRSEFERRVAFANTWFSDRTAFPRKTNARGKDADRGWDTDPGRVYILLGPPDYVMGTNGTDGVLEPFAPIRLYRDEDLTQADRVAFRRSMTWIYVRPRENLRVHFSLRAGQWSTDAFASRRGREAIEEAKLNYLAEDVHEEMKKPFRFSVKDVKGAVAFIIPTSLVNYGEEGGELVASLKVKLIIYRDGRREDVLEKTQDFAFTEDKLLATNNLEFSIPWQPREKGRYLLDITVTDLKALRFAAFRTYLRKNI